MNLRADELAQIGHVLSLGKGDDIVGSCHGMGHLHSWQPGCRIRKLRRLPGCRFDEDMGAESRDDPSCTHSEVRRQMGG